MGQGEISSRVDRHRRWPFALAVAAVVASLMGGFFWGFSHHQGKVASDMEDLAYYRNTYLWKSGGTTMVKNAYSYKLHSLDGGKNWYAIERTDDGRVVILGTAEEVFPGLLAHLSGMEALSDYVSKHGTITLSGDRFEGDRSVLEGAGFTIVGADDGAEKEP